MLRLFYSFYEIPPKVRKVEAVTYVTEKISKSKAKDKPEEKSEKQDDDKKTKGKREKPKEKRQGKISGKRKVSDESSVCRSDLKPSQVILSETGAAGVSVKRMQFDMSSLTNSLSLPKRVIAPVDARDCLEQDKTSTNSLLPQRPRQNFSSQSQQKTPQESTSYSVIAHSTIRDTDRLKGQDSKATIKLFIKSSDLRDGGCQISETVPENKDRKCQNSEPVSEMKQLQNGETKAISKTNLFEKMDTLARSSNLDLKELTSRSSHLQKLASNNKKLKEKDVKCDTKPNINIVKPKTTGKSTHLLSKVKPVNCSSHESVINVGPQSQSSPARERPTGACTKLSPRNSSVKREIKNDSDDTCRQKTSSETKQAQHESSVTIALPVAPAISNATKGHLTKANHGQKSAPDTQRVAVSSSQDIRVPGPADQDTKMSGPVDQGSRIPGSVDQGQKMNQTSQEQLDVPGSLNNNKQSITRHLINDVKQGVTVYKPNNVKMIGTDTKQAVPDTKNGVKLVVNGTNQSIGDNKVNNIQQSVSNTKQSLVDNKQDSVKQEVSDTKQNVADKKQNSVKQEISDTKQNISDNKLNTVTPAVGDANQNIVDYKQNNAKQVINDTKQILVDIKIPLPASKAAFDKNITAENVSKVSTDHSATNKTQPVPASKNGAISEEVIAILKERQSAPDGGVRETITKNESRCPSLKKDSVQSDVKVENQRPPLPNGEKKSSSFSKEGSDIPDLVSKSLVSDGVSRTVSVIPKVKISTSLNVATGVSSVKPQQISVEASAAVSASSAPAPSKLLKTTPLTSVSSSSCLPASYYVASAVSAVNVSISPSVPATASAAATSSTTNTAALSTVLAAAVPAKSSLAVSPITSAVTKTSLATSLVSLAAGTSQAVVLCSRSEDAPAASVKMKIQELNPVTLGVQVTKSDSASLPSEISSATMALVSVTPASSLSSATSSHRPYSLAFSVTTPSSAPSVTSMSAAVPNVTLSVTGTAINSWPTDTTVSVVNTFLNIPTTETYALKESNTKTPKISEPAVANQVTMEETIKLDNFLFDTKTSETTHPVTNSNHKIKELCNVVRQTQKNPIVKSKLNSSTQLHSLANDKSSKVADSHMTAIHHLPKTVSQTSKPYSVARSMSVSSASATKSSSSVIQTTKISTLIPKSSSISSKTGSFSKSFSYPATVSNVTSSRSFLHSSLSSHLPRPDISAVLNGTSGYERSMLTKSSALSTSSSIHASSAPVSASHHKASSSTKHGSKDDNKMEKSPKNRTIPPLTIPKSCLIGTTLKLQRSPGSSDHYIFAPLSHYGPAAHPSGERSKSKEVKHNGSRTPTSPPTPTKDGIFIGERQRVPTIKISDINRNPIIVESGGNSINNRHHSQCRSYNRGSSRATVSENGSAGAHGRGRSDSLSLAGNGDRSDRSSARDNRRPSDSELLLSRHWHGYTPADLLFNGFKLPSHPKFHDLHYDTDAMPLDYSQSSSKS